MKSLLIALVASILLDAPITTAPREGNQNLYTRDAIISEETAPEEYTVIDSDGEVWAFAGGNYESGEAVTLIMSDNGTVSIYDDEIVHVCR